MEKTVLNLFYHRGRLCIGIHFPRNPQLQRIIQKNADAKWSRTNTCWYIEASRENYLNLKKSVIENHYGTEENDELQKWWKTVSRQSENQVKQSASPNLRNPSGHIREKSKKDPGQNLLHVENVKALHSYRQELILKGYSSNTIRTYVNEFRIFLIAIKNHPAQEFTPGRLRDYLFYCHESLKLSENTIHSRMNALKFYYENILGRSKFFWEIPRPKKPRLLPKLLGEDELRRLFNALENKKHKAMLFTVYSAGLRVSEIVNLKLSDIDSDRMQIFVARAKGKKDRYVNLSPILLDILRSYIKDYHPRPKVYLFESEQTQLPYPTRTVQQVFSNAKNKAGIKKEVGIHSLRHSFATHLLEKGTDIKYIKDLLGHFNIKTTEIYLHVSRENLVNISSPFDDLWKKGKIVW